MSETSEKKVKVGDVVRLKSGGPLLTVTRDEPDGCGHVTCSRFNAAGKLKDYDLPPEAVDVEPEAARPHPASSMSLMSYLFNEGTRYAKRAAEKGGAAPPPIDPAPTGPSPTVA